ncbi:MAG TPA: glycoside hydrolase family 2 TIM barrel-domain containing protein [Bacteroidota bacterium]|nr:glycoside hydrolase family 2 TIM barrel-domain containing protein [Bacteroidota bacterium]
MRQLSALLLVMLLLSSFQAANAQWKIPSDAPLLTRWSKDVSSTHPWPEYPRPQLVREDWMNLNGLWEYSEAGADEAAPVGKSLGGRILVPYPIESALSGVMKHVERMWYRKTFSLPRAWSGKHVLLHFGAVDWEAVVYVNGTSVGQHRGGYDPFTFDITAALKEQGSQEIIVGVFDPTNQGDQPRGKQVLKPGGIMYTPTTGIWQTVWLEPVTDEHISSIVITPDADAKTVNVTVNTTGEASSQTVRLLVLDEGRQLVETEGKVGETIPIPIKSPKLWSPTHPFLYDLKVGLVRDKKAIDEVKSYFGMRTVKVSKDAQGLNRIMLNGQVLFMVGPLDQGFWPDGIYTAPTDKALRYDIEMTKKLGFNMARKHVKVEPDRWYYWADKLGLIVWQDMPSGNNKTDESKKEFESELERMVKTHRNHPSIVMWVVFNEGWGQYDTERLTGWVKQLDPSRLVNNASGWTDKRSGDVLDIHNYPAPKSPPPDSSRAIVLGEFGGLGLAIDGHTWKKEHWGYQGMADAAKLTARYEKFMREVYNLKESPGLSAAVYTQTTDVEVECNGLMTYDRALVKPVLERVAAVNKGDFSKIPPPPAVQVVVPTSEQEGRLWKYTTEKPTGEWFKTTFDDAGWQTGPGGFGTKDTPGAVVRTEWKTPDIWLRSEIEVPSHRLSNLHFRLHHDEDAEIYINGVLAASAGSYSMEYEELPVLPAGIKALRPGKNVIAVHCRQTEGGQYIDVGIVEHLPSKK